MISKRNLKLKKKKTSKIKSLFTNYSSKEVTIKISDFLKFENPLLNKKELPCPSLKELTAALNLLYE